MKFLTETEQTYIKVKSEALGIAQDEFIARLVSDSIARDKKPGAAPEIREFVGWLQNQLHDPIAREISSVFEAFLKGGSMPQRRDPSLYAIGLEKRIEIR